MLTNRTFSQRAYPTDDRSNRGYDPGVTGWRRAFDECLSGGARKRLHLSLARDDIRRARAFFNQAATDVQLNADQIDYVIDCAHDARRDAREHIRKAVAS